MNRWRRRTRIKFLALVLVLACHSNAQASVLGTENILLAQMLGAHLQEIASLSTIINNTRQTVAATNDLFALARVTHRMYQMLTHYRLEDLIADAKQGLYQGFPELAALDQEIGMSVDNVHAINQGSQAFFTHWDRHNPSVGEAVQKAFARGYKATLWPMAFPEAMRFYPNPSPAEALVQSHYLYSGEAARRAVQQTAMGVLTSKINYLAADAEAKDNTQLRMESLQTQLQYQTMRNTTDLLNLKEIEVADAESRRLADKQVAEHMQRDLTGLVDMLGEAKER